MSTLSKESIKKIGNNLYEWITIMDMCIIVPVSDQEDYEEAMDYLRKVTKKLQKGKIKSIIEPSMIDTFRDMLEKEAREDDE